MIKPACHLAILAAVLSTGCAEPLSGYPSVTAVNNAQKNQPCHQCGKIINQTSDENFLKLGAAQYIVCSESCRKKQAAWHESQFGK